MLHPGPVAADAVGQGELLVSIPEPLEKTLLGGRTGLESGATPPDVLGQRRRKLRLRQPAGHEQPAVVSDDSYRLEPGGEQ